MKSLKGDLVGGVIASLITMPRAIALGPLVFAPLGPEFFAIGIVAGLVAQFVSNLVGVVGSMPVMNNAPFSLSTFMLLAALNLIIAELGGDMSDPALAATAVALLFLTVSLSGLLQCLFSIFRIGDLAKFIPYPVLAGLLNGSALMIIFSQAEILLGLPEKGGVSELVAGKIGVQWPTVAVGLVTCLAIWGGPRLFKRVPAPIYGLLLGSGVYYLLLGFGVADLGAVIGHIPSMLPTPHFAVDFFELFTGLNHSEVIRSLFPLAFGIAAINSLRSLVVSTAAENLTGSRTDANQELLGQGLSNVASGMFGGISSAGSISSTLANYHYGARTRLSRAASGLFSLAALILLAPLIGEIPNVVLAALLVMVGLEAFDPWSLALIPRIRAALAEGDRAPLINAGIVNLVTLAVVFFGIFEGLGVGLACAVGWFLVRMSKSGIRNEFSADAVHSNTQRGSEELNLLEERGQRIRVLELEGALFFGTADKLAQRIERAVRAYEMDFLILCFRLVSEIDSTGAQIIRRLYERCQKANVTLMVSSVTPQRIQIYQEFRNSFKEEELQRFCFQEMESALACAEDRLLDQAIGFGRYDRELSLDQLEVLGFLTPGEFAIARNYLERLTFQTGEAVFHQGDAGDSVYFIVKGRARVLHGRGNGDQKRLGTLCPGIIFGELALVDGRPRSADVVALGNLVCYRLSLKQIEQISLESPQLSCKLLKGIARELATRLRIANRLLTRGS